MTLVKVKDDDGYLKDETTGAVLANKSAYEAWLARTRDSRRIDALEDKVDEMTGKVDAMTGKLDLVLAALTGKDAA